MFGIHDFGIFFLSSVVLILTPGPDTLYVLGRSLAQGASAGVASSMGICAGALLHTFAAALGLSVVLASSAMAFTVLKFLGAAYLLYLGVRMLLSKTEDHAVQSTFQEAGFWKIFRQGMLTNVLNPKVALFYLAFMPQFIDPNSSAKFFAFLLLGSSFIAAGISWCLIIAFGAAALGARIKKNAKFSAVLQRVAGTMFVLLGLRLASSGR